ncbi:MAG: alpha-L-fucosidase [Phycisphaerae bacterium]|nr:alpha-L-fucosidase [Phycisphaerae bacterium]
MNRRQFLQRVGAASVAAWGQGCFGDESGTADANGLPRPSRQQARWQDMELGMFFHFDIPIYKPGWDWRSWRDMPTPEMYNPSKLDTDQWMEAARAMGAKYAVLVAKHCSGFLQWQSDLYPYGVKQSPWRSGKGDVVGNFVTSCRKYGIQPGLYASVSANGYLEVDNPGLVNRGKGGDPAAQARYVRICEQMLTELWSRYGELFEIWFDGGALPVDKGGPDLVPIYQKHQPEAIVFQGPAASIRWIGNEQGVAGYPCWATVPHRQDYNGPGDPDGRYWLPGECDVPVRNHEWFWTPNADQKLYSVEQLMDMYYRSVGRNCNLLLNANPNPDGLVPEADFQRYVEFGKEIHRRFDAPIAQIQGKGDTVELKLAEPTRIDHVVVMEEILQGERIREYRIEGLVGADTWRTLCSGQSVGHKRIQQFDPAGVAKVRLRVLKSAAEPLIRSLAVYHAG